MNDNDAKTRGIAVSSHYGMDTVASYRQEMMRYLDYWANQSRDPATMRVFFECAFSVLVDLATEVYVLDNKVEIYHGCRLICPVIKQSVARGVLERMGLVENTPIRYEMESWKPIPMNQPSSTIFYMDFRYEGRV